MYQKYFSLVLCLFILGVSLAAESSSHGSQTDWSQTNTMSRENGEKHVPVRNSDHDIYIDDPQVGGYEEGSADDDYQDASGMGSDDEDDSQEGSAVGPGLKTQCQKLRDSLNRQQMVGAYIPRCTTEGDFAAKQCSAEGMCWCVNRYGQEIPLTSKKTPEQASCDNIDRETYLVVAPKKKPSGQQEPKPEDEEESKETSHRDDDIKTKIPNKDDEDSSKVEVVTLDPLGESEKNSGNSGAATYDDAHSKKLKRTSLIAQPGILAGIIGGAVVGLLCAVLLVMFIVYRMRKKDEGSYALDEPKRGSPSHQYQKARDREFFA